MLKNKFKPAIKKIAILAPLLELLLLPITVTSLLWFRYVKFVGIKKFPITRKMFYNIGAIPIVKHYYEPLFDPAQLTKPLNSCRELPGINFRLSEQMKLIQTFDFQNELQGIPIEKPNEINGNSYYYNNGSFQAGDADLYYSMIRMLRPSNIIEIGSGFSTLIALKAVESNKKDCEIICIEPYEMTWLEEHDVKIERKLVETLPLSYFSKLEADDILFIDSSHVIRPQGDVIYEILEILPRLEKGVYVHFHDIFSPNDYPIEWLTDEIRMWNEQYLLEAFLSNNSTFEIVISLNYLAQRYRSKINQIFPSTLSDNNQNPGSFWIKKIE